LSLGEEFKDVRDGKVLLRRTWGRLDGLDDVAGGYWEMGRKKSEGFAVVDAAETNNQRDPVEQTKTHIEK
jgi:hypothetical protein